VRQERADSPRARARACVRGYVRACVRACSSLHGGEQSEPRWHIEPAARAKKFRGVTTAYRVTEGRREAFRAGERRDVEFQWRIKMRCLDENEKISGHGRADGRPFKL